MTQTLPPITERITYDPATHLPGTVYTAGWVPRPDPQSPDLTPPTYEEVTLAELIRLSAETVPVVDLAAPVVVLAEVMPAPVVLGHTPLWAQGRRRRSSHVAPWVWMSLGAGLFAVPAVAALLVLAVVR